MSPSHVFTVLTSTFSRFKMAGGFNRYGGGFERGMDTYEGGNISPWIDRPHIDPYSHQHMPQPPPPPLMFEGVSASVDYHQERITENWNENHFQRNASSSNFNRNYQGSRGNTERQDYYGGGPQQNTAYFGNRSNKQGNNSRNHYDRDKYYDRKRNKNNHQQRRQRHRNHPIEGSGKNCASRKADSEQNQNYDRCNSNSNTNNDVECLSPWPTSPAADHSLSDANHSPDLAKIAAEKPGVEVRQGATQPGGSELNQPLESQSQLEQAYMRRLSQTSNSPEISVILPSCNIPALEQQQMDEGTVTPASPDNR